MSEQTAVATEQRRNNSAGWIAAIASAVLTVLALAQPGLSCNEDMQRRRGAADERTAQIRQVEADQETRLREDRGAIGELRTDMAVIRGEIERLGDHLSVDVRPRDWGRRP